MKNKFIKLVFVAFALRQDNPIITFESADAGNRFIR